MGTEALLLGIVQGITEWLPISSEGINTLLLVNIFQKPVEDAILISLWLHGGTFLAALVFFRRDIAQLLGHIPHYLGELRGGLVGPLGNTLSFLILATGLSGLLGLPLLLLAIREKEFSSPHLVTAALGALLIISGLVQRLARTRVGVRGQASTGDGLVVGLAQAVSVLPGLSRSGLTVSALLLLGIHPSQAIRLSFLMSLPAVLGLMSWFLVTGQGHFAVQDLAGLGTAFLFGLLTIGLLTRAAQRVPFWKFSLFMGGLSLVPLLLKLV